ncbi:MAG: gamma-glutamylcyclotransferase [Ferruginibacter sp.]
MNRIFVYGTLRNGMLNQVVPQVSAYIHADAKGFVNGRLFDTGEYPAAKPNKLNQTKVYGDVLLVDDSQIENVLNVLDNYEEINEHEPEKSLFKRKLVDVNITSGKKIRAWIYWYNRDIKGFKELKSGIYRKRKIAY